MNTINFYKTHERAHKLLASEKNDVFNQLPDENFPKHPPSNKTTTKSQPLFKIRSPSGDGQSLARVFRPLNTSLHKKKKEVVFSEELEERCSISPKKMEPEQLKLNLAKKAKKGILRGVASSCNNIPEPSKPVKNEEQRIMSMALDTSILLEYDAAQREPKSEKSIEVKLPGDEKEAPVKSLKANEEREDSNNSVISIEDNDIMAGQKYVDVKSSLILDAPEKSNKKVQETTKPSIPLNENIQRWVSMSDVLLPAEKPEIRQNRSSITGSLNELPLIGTPREAANGSTTPSSNEHSRINQNSLLKKPIGFSQAMKNQELQGILDSVKKTNEEKSTVKLPLINAFSSSFTQSPAYFSDVKTGSQPLIKGGYHPMVRQQGSKENFPLGGTQLLKGPSFTMNTDIAKLQAAHSNLLGMKSFTSLAQTKPKCSFNVSEASNSGPNTFCLNNGNQGVWYCLKEGTYRFLGQDLGLGLEGSGYCKASEDSIVVTGGTDHQQNKVVSSKAMLVNLRKGEKEMIPGMPIARYNHGVYVSGKNVFTVGGQSFDEKVLKSCYLFEMASKNWQRIPSLQYERTHPLVFGNSKGSVYVMGGTDSQGKEVAWVEKFDQQKQSWQLVYNTLKMRFSSKDAVVLGNTSFSGSEEALILVKEGKVDSSNYKFALYSYNMENETLTKQTDFQFEAHGPGVQGFVAGNCIYLTERGKWGTMDEYNLESHIWRQKCFGRAG